MLENGLFVRYGLNRHEELVSLQAVKTRGEALAHVDYEYDVRGNRTKATVHHRQNSATFTVDAVERLVSEHGTGNAGFPSTYTNQFPTQRERDDEAGLMYFRARSYDPHLGRFVQKEPSKGTHEFPTPQLMTRFAQAEISSWNYYAYVDNAPTAFTDQHGLFKILAPPIHEEITRTGLANFFDNPAIGAFIGQVIQADTAEFGDPVAHFDNGMIEEGWTRVAQRRTNIVDAARGTLTPTGSIHVGTGISDVVELNFGRLLHAVQDFYSHTNYIELYIVASNRRSGQQMKGAQAWPYPDLPIISEARSNPLYADFSKLLDEALTSGAYGAEAVRKALKEGKPTHDDIYETGFLGLKKRPIKLGLNKDAPGRPLHEVARKLAEKETSFQAKKMKESLSLWLGDGHASSFLRLMGGKQ